MKPSKVISYALTGVVIILVFAVLLTAGTWFAHAFASWASKLTDREFVLLIVLIWALLK